MIEKHSRARQIELGQSIRDRRKIYLDTKFWIILRDTELGIRTGAPERKLLHFLRCGVRSGKLLCPISAMLFLEIMKQPHTPKRRRATAKLIDELSLGVASMEPRRLLATEIYHFMLSALGEIDLHTMQELIWTKSTYVLGDMYPHIPELPIQDQTDIQIRFFDYLWNISLSDMLDTIGDIKWTDRYQQLSQHTNEQNIIHRDDLKSFEGAYDIELRGAIEAAGEIGADVIADLVNKKSGRIIIPTAEEREASVKQCQNLIYAAMKQARNRVSLRTLHVSSSIHAGMRWDKGRKFKPNDWYDFGHAEIALTYCDAFFTEAPLHFLVTRPPLQLNRVNNCKVASDIIDASEITRNYIQ